MHLVYFSHSYRDPDAGVNAIFEELMVSEGMTPSLDPPSDRLNSAKPERHLRATDGMIAIVPYRTGGPSAYILYEISLAVRARLPVLVFLEDMLSSDVLPSSVMARRFSRRSLLREIRDHRHALRLLKAYMGEDPPPTYQPSVTQRSCLVIGGSSLPEPLQRCIQDQLTALQYCPAHAAPGDNFLLSRTEQEQLLTQASFALALSDSLTPHDCYLLGAARAFLTPSIIFTGDRDYPYHPRVPKEYQPRLVDMKDADSICVQLRTEVAVFEEDYLDLKDQQKVERYKSALFTHDNRYSEDARQNIINVVGTNTQIDMSKNKTQFRDNFGNINIDSKLEKVTQFVSTAPALQNDKGRELLALVQELGAALKTVNADRVDDSERVAQSAELVVKEAAKEKPNRGFLNLTVEGLKEAAKAVQDIAPTVLEVAGKIALFVVGMKP